MRGLTHILILLTFLSLPAMAVEVTEDFSTRDRLDANSTAIWNHALGKIHPSLQVVDYKIGYTTPLDFSVGDGSHGAFELSTYARFSVGGDISGNTIRLDLARFPILKVTRFQLEDGWILEPVGSAPLIIYSLSTVVINGQIWCHGRDGTNAVNTTPGAGGLGRCGGANGGDGGAQNGDGENGDSVHSSVSGGQGGKFTGGAAVGGGGGGSWNISGNPADGTNADTVTFTNGGLGGTSVSDPEFTIEAGGAGGGGGSGTATSAGAGGGAGGGLVMIHAVGDVAFGVNGYINAKGGNGGTSNATGGAGGGGAGGSVKVFSGGTIDIDSMTPASEALAGAVGASGGKGRSWMASVGFLTAAGLSYDPGEEAPLDPDTQTVAFATTPQFIETRSMDLDSTLPVIESLLVSPASSDFLLEIKGSSDNFVSDQTTWTTNLASVSNKRYVKLRLTITTPAIDRFDPTMADLVRFKYSRQTRNQFDFKSGGCGAVGPTQFPPWGLFLLILPLLLGLCLRRLEAHSVEQNTIHKT